jgi:hypothetical protein
VRSGLPRVRSGGDRPSTSYRERKRETQTLPNKALQLTAPGATLPGTAAERRSVGHAESLGSWRVLLNLEGFEASELSLRVLLRRGRPARATAAPTSSCL